VPVTGNGMPGFARYKPAADGDGYAARAIQAPEIRGNRIVRLTAFLDVAAGRRPSPCTPRDALAALYSAEAADLSRRELSPVTIDEVTRPAAA
jgi:hypothetical protein